MRAYNRRPLPPEEKPTEISNWIPVIYLALLILILFVLIKVQS